MINKKNLILKLLPVLILLITITSVNPWSMFPLNTAITWFIYAITIFATLWYIKTFFNTKHAPIYTIVGVYFIWMLIGVVRGMFIADGYWEWKQWAAGSTALSLPIFAYAFSIPWLLSNTLKIWFKFALPLFFICYVWSLANYTAFQFFLGPVFIMGCFIPIVPNKKWRYILIAILIFLLVVEIDARSQIIKVILAILLSLACFFYKLVPLKIIKLFFWIFIFSPIVLLYLGIMGEFNVFKDLSDSSETSIIADSPENSEAVLMSDTRTFIYNEVISSALKNNYIWFGRTPTRGNDSVAFGAYNAEFLGKGKYQRHKNEMCFPNLFTWLGLIGMLLYCSIYFKAAYLAIYKSKNIYLKIVGLFIAFHFAFGWVEDINSFDILSISLWMMIAIGLSTQFRNMNNNEFKYWISTIFNKK